MKNDKTDKKLDLTNIFNQETNNDLTPADIPDNSSDLSEDTQPKPDDKVFNVVTTPFYHKD